MSTSTSKSNSLVLGLGSGAPLGLALFALLLGLGVPPVKEWFWPTPTTNIAEAAAIGDAARVRWLALQGISLEQPWPLRDEIRTSGAPPVMSPLEAAIRHRAEAIPELLLELGARPSADEAHRLYCLAAEMDATQTAELLHEKLGVSSPSCAGVPPETP